MMTKRQYKRAMLFTCFFLSSVAKAENVQVLIDVDAMTCPLCVTVVNQALRKTDGVVHAKSSMKTKQAKVIVPEGFDTARLVAAIEATGYQAVIHGANAQR